MIKDSPYFFASIPDEVRRTLPRSAPNDPLPTPVEPEYPAGWWVLYVVVVLLSIAASAIWPGPWFGG